MKITRIETIPVLVPLKKGLSTKTAHGEHVVSEYVIIRVHTDEGLVGLGEATVAPRWTGETSGGAVVAVRTLFEPALLGLDPRHITTARRRMDVVCKLNPFTKAGIEMALWDLAGKSLGVPVHQLLGGKVRDAARIKMVVGAFDDAHVRRLTNDFLAWGVTCIKVKTGIDPDGDVARVRAVREMVGPDLPLTIDSNCGWTVSTAKSTLRRLADLGVTIAEQPIPPHDPLALAEVRRESPIPIMADESVFTLEDAWRLTAARAVDILSVYPGKHGGIAGTAEIIQVARAAGLRCAIGSNLELGIGTAAMLHVAAAFPEVDSQLCPADLIGPLYHEADLLTEPLSLGPVEARVPDGPGLGVELDEHQLRRYGADAVRL